MQEHYFYCDQIFKLLESVKKKPIQGVWVKL